MPKQKKKRSDWGKLFVDFFERDDMAAAIRKSSFATAAFMWIFTNCGKDRSETFERSETEVRGGAAKANIDPEDIHAGLDALEGEGIIARPGEDEFFFHEWPESQSDYMRRVEKRKSEGNEVKHWDRSTAEAQPIDPESDSEQIFVFACELFIEAGYKTPSRETKAGQEWVDSTQSLLDDKRKITRERIEEVLRYANQDTEGSPKFPGWRIACKNLPQFVRKWDNIWPGMDRKKSGKNSGRSEAGKKAAADPIPKGR